MTYRWRFDPLKNLNKVPNYAAIVAKSSVAKNCELRPRFLHSRVIQTNPTVKFLYTFDTQQTRSAQLELLRAELARRLVKEFESINIQSEVEVRLLATKRQRMTNGTLNSINGLWKKDTDNGLHLTIDTTHLDVEDLQKVLNYISVASRDLIEDGVDVDICESRIKKFISAKKKQFILSEIVPVLVDVAYLERIKAIPSDKFNGITYQYEL